MFYNQRYIGDYIIQRFQREYLERCEDRKSYNYLASRRFRFVGHRKTDNNARLGMTYSVALLSSCMVDIMYHILQLGWMVR